MNDFLFYLQQGVNHILDLEGIDHVVFIITMCAAYQISQWRNSAVLITAFTIGHTVTLALAGLDIIRIQPEIIETLIPITILITSIFNVSNQNKSAKKVNVNYLIALIFGLIHGMGFSNFFRSMMMGIVDDSIVLPLFSFNVGIELGQIIIGILFFSSLFLLTKFLKVKHQSWNIYISGAGGGIAATMIINALL